MASLDNMAPRTADVYRGSEMTTWAEEVVVGDTVFLKVKCLRMMNEGVPAGSEIQWLLFADYDGH